jgi:hypothetical protein
VYAIEWGVRDRFYMGGVMAGTARTTDIKRQYMGGVRNKWLIKRSVEKMDIGVGNT